MESSSTLASPSSAVESGVSHVRFEESSSVVEEPIPRIRDTLASPVSNHVEIPSMKLSSLDSSRPPFRRSQSERISHPVSPPVQRQLPVRKNDSSFSPPFLSNRATSSASLPVFRRPDMDVMSSSHPRIVYSPSMFGTAERKTLADEAAATCPDVGCIDPLQRTLERGQSFTKGKRPETLVELNKHMFKNPGPDSYEATSSFSSTQQTFNTVLQSQTAKAVKCISPPNRPPSRSSASLTKQNSDAIFDRLYHKKTKSFEQSVSQRLEKTDPQLPAGFSGGRDLFKEEIINSSEHEIGGSSDVYTSEFDQKKLRKQGSGRIRTVKEDEHRNRDSVRKMDEFLATVAFQFQ